MSLLVIINNTMIICIMGDNQYCRIFNNNMCSFKYRNPLDVISSKELVEDVELLFDRGPVHIQL